MCVPGGSSLQICNLIPPLMSCETLESCFTGLRLVPSSVKEEETHFIRPWSS